MAATVGMPLCLDSLGRWRPGRSYHYVDAAYALAIEQARGVPIYLPLQSDPGVLLERIDALLIPGGDDLLPPSPYPDGVRFDPAPPEQLEFDRGLLAAALARGLPVLGICYGAQLIAMHFGGRLHYDLPSDVPEAQDHQLPEPHGRHGLRVEPGTRLARILGPNAEQVNSLHHQAVSDPGRELRVAARAEDGVIESIECDDRFCIGVQWHPEKLPDRGLPLFRALVEAAED